MPAMFTRLLALKIGLVVVMVVLQAIDQLGVRPRRIAALREMAQDVEVLPSPLLKWQRWSQHIATTMIVLAAVVVGLGVMLTR